MKVLHHLIVVLICLGIIIFEYKTFPEIMNTAYMIGLVVILTIVGYYHFVVGLIKVLKFRNYLLMSN